MFEFVHPLMIRACSWTPSLHCRNSNGVSRHSRDLLSDKWDQNLLSEAIFHVCSWPPSFCENTHQPYESRKPSEKYREKGVSFLSVVIQGLTKLHGLTPSYRSFWTSLLTAMVLRTAKVWPQGGNGESKVGARLNRSRNGPFVHSPGETAWL